MKKSVLIFLVVAAAVAAAHFAPSKGRSAPAGGVTAIADEAAYNEAMKASRGRLAVIDFYADWCTPCRRLAPILEELAERFSGEVDFYKVDVEAQRALARKVGVRGVPFVHFVVDGRPVHAMMGLSPKEAYGRAVQRFSPSSAKTGPEKPDGRLVRGVRVVERSARSAFDSVYVYRGETVRLRVTGIDFPYGIAIPEYGIREEARPNEPLEVTFKAKRVGVFPVFCNGLCPSGEESRQGQVVVVPFDAGAEVSFAEISAHGAKAVVENESPLVLDVRTPGEYYAGRIPGARLIPVQQLQARIGEIADHKQKKILIYCRSGNRSVVAAEILAEAGFTDIVHLSGGILDWQRAGYALVN